MCSGHPGDLVLTDTHSLFRSDCQGDLSGSSPPPSLLAVFWDMSQVPENCGTIRKVQRSSLMCSVQLAMKSKATYSICLLKVRM
ncbi:unnamed protein product, partial [Staurois parvus]